MNINLDHISVEHKKDALERYCLKRPYCSDDVNGYECPLYCAIPSVASCYTDCTDEEINRNYELVFGDKEVKEPVEEPVEKATHTVPSGLYDNVNHPQHYNHGSMECIDEMILIFGVEAVMDFCACNAWKYRARAAYKGNPEEDMAKADWYIAKYKELEELDNETYRKLP